LPQLRVLFTQEEIRSVVGRLAKEIDRDYEGKNPLLIGVLKGAAIFIADLVRLLNIPLEVEFVRLSSYGKGKVSSGKIRVVRGLLRLSIKDRDVLVVEDIVDTGITLDFLLSWLHRKRPASLRVCALFDKAMCRKVSVPIDYLGLSIPNEFVVGYGLDWDEKFRNLPDLYVLEEENQPEGT
jgi:hypoxanthine phosphoribosyltransferase